jgi:hypothetical protein
MLGDDTDLDDTALISDTAAAMRELASTVTDAPPLRLAPRLGTARVPPPRPAALGRLDDSARGRRSSHHARHHPGSAER